MTRVNAFLEAGNDAGRRVSLGGRSCSDEVWAWLNTDNATKSGCDMRARAEVVGPGLRSKDRKRKDGDGRKSVFTVELPDQTDDNCEVHICAHGERLRGLVAIGAMLCGVKATCDAAAGNTEQAIRTVKQASKLLAECEAEATKNLPTVYLPGGATLAHALACVEVCRRLATHQDKKHN